MFNIIAEIVIPISVTLAAIFCGMWKGESDYSKVLQRALDEYEDEHKEDFEKLEKRYKEDLALYKKMALDAAERADRNGAIAEGLAEGLADIRALCEERFTNGPEWIAPYFRLWYYHDWAVPAYQLDNVYFSVRGW